MQIDSENLEVMDWGLLSYGEAFERQKDLVQERIDERVPDRLVMVEHRPVVTIGKSGGKKDLRLPETFLRGKGVEVYRTDRGGQATYHGPGQMVAYPILKLKNTDLHAYVQSLLQTVAVVLRDYGLEPEFKAGNPGLWLEGKKIASIGIGVKRWVTYHGIALNVNTDLKVFNWIVPCGHAGEIVTSMERELGRPLDMAKVKTRFIIAFQQLFGCGPAVTGKQPHWLTLPSPLTREADRVDGLLSDLQLNTVCQSAHCPNIGECFARGTATFMILGRRCTRSCRFCAVEKGYPEPLDLDEPQRVARAVRQLDLQYVVITSVTRDDLSDGGAAQFARTIESIRRLCPGTRVDVLIPDFKGSLAAVKKVCDVHPDMFNHNVETVPRLYPLVRPQANYQRSLNVLSSAAGQGLKIKTGLMLGFGETAEEIAEVLSALRRVGCDYLTLGQYLAPSYQHVPVARYVPPKEFDKWALKARQMGFKQVASGPLVRSSYQADQMNRAVADNKCCA